MEERGNMTNEVAIVEETNEGFEISGGLGAIIGSALTLAVIVGGKQLKKAWTNHKAKKKPDKVIDGESRDVEDEPDKDSMAEEKE